MKKIVLTLAALCLVLAACSNDTNKESKPSAVQNSAPEENTPNEPVGGSNSNPDEQVKDNEQKTEEAAPVELDLDNIENVNVKGDLLKSVMSILEAVKINDVKARQELTYDPKTFDPFDGLDEATAITKIEQDDSRVKDISDEYSLKSFAEEVAIVKVSIESRGSIGTGDYIFVKVKDQWKVYRHQ